jgi:hypothetical protein
MGDYSEMMARITTEEGIFKRFGDIETHPDEILTPYKEFSIAGNTYYFAPVGSSTGRTPARK